MRFAPTIAALLALGMAAHAQTPVIELGKERAAASALQWDVREAGHPTLGPIVFAMLKKPIATAVGTNRISSNIYVSCERSTAKIAIELANGTRTDDPGGLKAKTMPRLTCNTVGVNGKAASEPIAATWIANELGDVMARGLWPSVLRDCASIGVSEELALPAGWGRETARVEFEFSPYVREIDGVFARCGEPTAYPLPGEPPSAAVAAAPPAASAPAPAPASAPPPAPKPSLAAGAPAAQGADAWISMRVVSEGRTNVRAKPNLRSALVITLDPGDVVLVQKTAGEWLHVRSQPKAKVPFEGYIRRDRLVMR
jgi:hypothetical protein